jgi:phage FluMu gp28-like protein
VRQRPLVQLFPYQKKWVRDFSRLKICNKARQVGITFTETLSIVQRLVAKKQKWYYLSISQDRAQEAIEYAIMHAIAIGTAMTNRNLEVGFFEDTKYKQLTLTFPNGSKLIGLPANARTARGCSGNVTLDEFAHHQDAGAIWTSVMPIITWGGNLHIISTPNGLQGEYARIWIGPEKFNADAIEDSLRGGIDICDDRWSRHMINVYDAAEGGHPVDVEFCREVAGDEETFQQEYMCKFLDEAHAWLPYSLIDSCTHSDAVLYWDHTQKPSGPLWVGSDVGRKHDLFTIWINEQRGKTHSTRGVIALRNQPFKTQRKTLWDVMPFARRACIDETGIGAQLAEESLERWGDSMIEPISMAGDRPAKLATKLRRHLEEKTLLLPDCGDVRRDLHMVRRTYTDLGKVRFDAPRTKDGHADRFWACALALNAADTGFVPIKSGDYQSIEGIGRDWDAFR